MKSLWFASSVVLLMGTAFAQESAPVVSEATMAQDRSRLVTITYKLDKPAIVTLDIETNVVGTAEWVTIGGENIGNVVGDANVFVKSAEGRKTIYWQPDKSWPNHRIRNNGARAVVRAWAKDAPPDWMLIDLSVKSNIFYYASVGTLPFGHPTNSIYKTSAILMRKIPAAGQSFRMGLAAGEGEQSCFVDGSKFTTWGDFQSFASKSAPRLVSFTNDYYLSIFQLTDGQLFLSTGSTGSTYKNSTKQVEPYDECPAAGFSYAGIRGTYNETNPYDWPKNGHAVQKDSIMGKIRAFSGVDVDIPTEAQWEYACRAGESRYRYDGGFTALADGADALGWNSSNSGGKAHPAGRKAPNAWYIYDMYGNGYEWCLDYFESGYATCGTVEPQGPETGSERVLRGCMVSNDQRYMASAWRFKYPRGNGDANFTCRLAAPAIAK